MIEHARIVSRNFEAARRFYCAAAPVVGLSVMPTGQDCFCIGKGEAEDGLLLWVGEAKPAFWDGELLADTDTGVDVAFEAQDDFSVRAFYRAALEAGGRSQGYPAPRPTGGRGSYYAATVIDPDGNRVECGWRH